MNVIERTLSTAPLSAAVDFTPKENPATASDIKAVNVTQTLMTENHQTSTPISEMSTAKLRARTTAKCRRSRIMVNRGSYHIAYYHRDCVLRKNLKKSIGEERFGEIINRLDDAYSQKNPLDKAYFMAHINKYLTKEKYPALFMKYDNNKESLADIFCNCTKLHTYNVFIQHEQNIKIDKEEYKELKDLQNKISSKYHTAKRKNSYVKLRHINIDEYQSLESLSPYSAYSSSDSTNKDKTTEAITYEATTQKNNEAVDSQLLGYLKELIASNNKMLDDLEKSITPDNQFLDHIVNKPITDQNPHLDDINELMTVNNALDNVEPLPVITASQKKAITSATVPLSITLPIGLTISGINEGNIEQACKLLEMLK